MDTLQFLQTVLPANGLKCVAVPLKDLTPEIEKGWRHYVREGFDQIMESARTLGEDGKNIYFALGTLREPFLPSLTKTYDNGEPKQEIRVKRNIAQLKTFFLDIDIKANEPESHYVSFETAWDALYGFVQAAGLPMPYIVCSGGGMHVYFPFDTPLNRDDWIAEASKFKEICKHYGIKADHQLTANCANVLRLPGTVNTKQKDNPRSVFIMAEGTVARLTDLQLLFANKIKELNLIVREPVQPTAKNSILAAMAVTSEPLDPHPIFTYCLQMQQVMVKAGNVSEPLWYAAIQTARHFSDANKIIHAISKGHPEYSHEATEVKIAQLEQGGFGPASCGRFSDANPVGCNGCAFRDRVTNPANIKRLLAAPAPQVTVEEPEAAQPVVPIQAPVTQAVYEEVATTMVTVDGQFAELPEAPYPYFRNADGEVLVRKYAEKDGDGHKKGDELLPLTILKYDLYPYKREMSIAEGGEVVWFRRYLPHDGWRDFAVPTSSFYATEKIFKILADNGVLPMQSVKLQVVGYMTAYAHALQSAGKAVEMHAHFGWLEDEKTFVVGDRVYHADGRVVKSGVSKAIADEAKNLAMKGDINVWRNAFNIYNRKGYEQWAFMAMLGFGAPLLKFTGYSGVIVDLHGPSGSGKSTATKFAASVFGQPKENILRLDDTGVSKFKVLGTYHNLAVTLDEITNIKPQELSQFAYAVTEGREKRRMSSDAVLRNDSEEWQTLVLASSNARIMDKLTLAKGNVTAEQMRVFEMYAPVQDGIEKKQMDAVLRALKENHGTAGHVYAHYLATNVQTVKQRIVQVMELVGSKTGSQNNERFWDAVVTVAVVGAAIAKELKLHSYDVMHLLNWGVNHIAKLRGHVNETKANSIEVLGHFFQEFASNKLVTGKAIMGDAALVQEPRGELIIRIDTESCMTYVDKRKFRSWCIEQQYSPDEICEDLAQLGVLIDGHRDQRSFSMGSKTIYAGASVKVLVFDLRHAAAGNGRPTTVEGRTA